MRLPRALWALPADVSEQLLAMPLTAEERHDVASSLLSMSYQPEFVAAFNSTNKNAPRPDGLRGV